MTSAASLFRRLPAPAALLAALCLAGGYGLADDQAAAPDGVAEPPAAAESADDSAPLLMNKFRLTERMYDGERFWRAARGDKGFREYYRLHTNSRRMDPPGAVRDADYSLDKDEFYATIYRPAGFSTHDVAEWGVFVMLMEEPWRRVWEGDVADIDKGLAEVLARRKLFLVMPHLAKSDSDIRVAALAMDALRTLRAEYPGLSDKRVFLGGQGRYARVAGIATLNFPERFRGCFVHNGAPVVAKINHARTRNEEKRTIVTYPDTEHESDFPYLNNRDFDLLRRRVRFAGIVNKPPLTFEHSETVRGLHKLLGKRFPVRLLDKTGQGDILILPEDLGRCLDWLDGKRTPPWPVEPHFGYDISWPKKDP